MRGVQISLVALTALISGCSAGITYYDCSNPRSRWDYWWYAENPVVRCPPGSSCSITPSGKMPITWSVTGAPIQYRIAEQAAKGFDGGYTYVESGYYDTTSALPIASGSIARPWLKQWYVVTDLDCKGCTDIDTCGDSIPTTTWVPCTDKSCSEIEASDATARCDSGNHCSQ